MLLPNGAPPPSESEEEKIYILITELLDPETRETALLELSKKREMYEDLALVLWGGFGKFALGVTDTEERHHVLSALGDRQRLPRFISPFSHSARLQPSLQRPCPASMRCQSCRYTKPLLEWCDTTFPTPLIPAHVPLFLYPFLNTTSKTRPFEYLRLTSLGVIGALVKVRPIPWLR